MLLLLEVLVLVEAPGGPAGLEMTHCERRDPLDPRNHSSRLQGAARGRTKTHGCAAGQTCTPAWHLVKRDIVFHV